VVQNIKKKGLEWIVLPRLLKLSLKPTFYSFLYGLHIQSNKNLLP
jgi:hypothetical protein